VGVDQGVYYHGRKQIINKRIKKSIEGHVVINVEGKTEQVKKRLKVPT
jgi:hypothetical protein